MNLERLTDFLAREWREVVAGLSRSAPSPDQGRDEAGLIEAATGGAEARQFLESRPVQDFMAKAEAQLTHAMLSLPLDDHEGRRNLACAVNATRGTWKYLAALASDGKAAERALADLQSGRRLFF